MVSSNQAFGLCQRYQDSPISFFTEVLDVKPEHVWDKMDEVVVSVRDFNRTCVYAGHSVSKSYSVARLAVWFLAVFGPKATVITTAPSNDQVENILWREIATAYNKSRFKLGGTLTKTKLDLGANLTPPESKWFAYGFATKPDTVTGEATRFQGYHNDHVLVIFDEAAGILPQIWKAAEHLLTSEESDDSHWRWVAIGNPTSPYGQFAACENDEEWNCITISVKDTPNFKENRMVIPGLSGRKYEKRMRDKYGEGSNEYKVRILGCKPTYGEGTFYGRQMAEAEDKKHLRDMPVEISIPVHRFWDIGHRFTAIIFVQLIDGWIHIVDGYYDDTGKGIAGYAIDLQLKKHIWGDDWGPPDLDASNKQSFQTGQATLDIAHEAGIDFKLVPKHSVMDRVAAVTNILSTKCLFHINVPGVRMIVDAMRKYRQRRNESLCTDERPEYFKDAVKDWTRHPADAFGHMAIAYRFDCIKGHRPSYLQSVGALDTYGGNPWDGGI